MAHTYAGILGPLAFLTSLARGAVHGGPVESVLLAAWCSLLVFAPVGYVIGRLAQRIIEESVSATISAELVAREAAQPSKPTAAESDAASGHQATSRPWSQAPLGQGEPG